MSNLKGKQGSSRKKTIIIVSSVLVVLIGLGAGLGVAFGGTSGKDSDTIKTTDPNTNTGDGTTTPTEKTYWEVTTEKNSTDSTKQLKTLRITKEATTEQHLKDAYVEMVNKKVEVSSFNELLLPYHLRDVITEKRAKEILHVETLTSSQFGYIFNKNDWGDGQGDYGQGEKNVQRIVELNLPKNVSAIKQSQFINNKIRKVNWTELTVLKTIGSGAFYSNSLTGDLDLSTLTSLTSIGESSFAVNNLNGTLTLPPNIITIEQNAFSFPGYDTNKIKGTLKLPKTLETIGGNAFLYNTIEVLDWSEAKALKTIGYNAFTSNRLKTLEFNATVLPKLEAIGGGAFSGNTGQNDSAEMFITNFTLPTSLKTIGNGAFKVADGITITVSTNTTGINANSFIGKPIIKTPTTTNDKP